MSALRLRRVDAQAHACAQAVKRWRRAGVVAGSSSLQRPHDYLHFHAQGDSGGWQGLIAARDWLHHSLPQLQSLLKIECPLASIVELFRAVPRPLRLEVQALHYRALADVRLVEPAQLPTGDLPWLDTAQGRVWLTRLPAQRVTHAAMEGDSWLSDLPLRLALVLGISHLGHGCRIRLNEGDVLRITQLTQQCWLAQRCLGVFTFTEEGLHMQSTVADANGQDTSVLDLDSVPVRLEFVLATHEISLAALSQIIDGQLIPLAEQAAHHIEIRANGKPVARGELVQLDDQLGVELLEVYRTLSEHSR